MKHILYSLIIIFALSACQSGGQSSEANELIYKKRNIEYDESLKPFYHGVASGDPLSDRVIIWTRLTPEENPPQEVSWKVAADSSMNQIVRQGRFTTAADRDYTVKIDVDSLEADQVYFYQFEALGSLSPVGRTKTAPTTSKNNLRFAFASCSNYEFGYFNAYGHMARQPIFEAVVHLGDYIYEYGIGTYGDTTLGRFNVPSHEIISLEDYRTRYSLYRADADLQAAHANHPWITIWDDHEISNNAYQEGAQNHSPDTEGDYMSRKEAAVKAYYEWMPIRGNAGDKHYRSFDFGELAKLMVLDGRLAGRSKPADSVLTIDYMDSNRTMLGQSQREWLQNEIGSTNATWKVIGNQVIFSGIDASHMKGSPDKFMDMWDGYPAERAKLIEFLKAEEVNNLIIGTGDFHSSMALEIPDDPLQPHTYEREDETQKLGVEFVVHSINASNVNEWVGEDTAQMVKQLYMEPAHNPHIRHANLSDHGYVELSLSPEAAQIEWKYLNTLKEKDTSLKHTHVMRTASKTSRLELVP